MLGLSALPASNEPPVPHSLSWGDECVLPQLSYIALPL